MNLKELRKQRKLTLKQVSEGMNMPISCISKFEAGLTKMKPEIKERFCKFYNVEDFDELNRREEYNSQKDLLSILKKILKFNIAVGETTRGKIAILERNIMEISDLDYYILKRFIDDNDLKIVYLKGDK